MSNLKNKVAVVTGGNSGIGYATAQEFIAQGAKVIITGRKQAAVEEAVATLGNGTVGYVSDQGDLKAIDALVEKVKANYGSVDVLFINAGVGYFLPIDAVTEDHFDSIVDVNFKGAFFTLSKFIPLLKEGSSVTFLSSVNAYTGMATSSIYSASKAGLNSIARTAATELAPKGIRVNTVNPGPVVTPIFGKTGMDQETLDGFTTAMAATVPLKRLGKSEEIAKLVSFISSDDAAFITGAEYNIDGGLMLQRVFN